MDEERVHKPVLVSEVIEFLKAKEGGNFIDATLDGGGHTQAILEANPKNKVLGIEWDEEILKEAGERLANFYKEQRFVSANDNFKNLKEIIALHPEIKPIKGILFDLGLSLWHLERSGRGFSFQRNEPLDMRFNPSTQFEKASDFLNSYDLSSLEKILRDYGQERFYRIIAKVILESRKKKKIETTFDLVELLYQALPRSAREGRIHFATKTFQALRIATNQELDNLSDTLNLLPEILSRGSKVIVISFHSLEDRIAKNTFKNLSKEGKINLIIKKPMTPAREEVKSNPRSRSAKMRVVEII